MKLRVVKSILQVNTKVPTSSKSQRTKALYDPKGKFIGYVVLDSGVLLTRSGNTSEAYLSRLRKNLTHEKRRQASIPFL